LLMSQFLDYLYKLRNQGSSFGLQRMEELVQNFENPQFSYPVIHVAGTNGKGSVCAMLSSAYRANGYKVGLFSSPHLVELGERVQVNGKNTPMHEIEQIVDRIKPVAEAMEKKQPGMHPTFFEIMTMVAFLVFQKEKVDIAVIETGLGGRLDSTNVVRPALSIISSISLDHCEILGPGISNIAREKAGIIKAKTPVLCGWLPKPALQEIEQKAAEEKAEMIYLDTETVQCPQTNLVGAYQRRNAALAMRALQVMQPHLSTDSSKNEKGLLTTELAGRWQLIQGSPLIILDACHNEAGIDCLMENIRAMKKIPQRLWFSAMGEERANSMVNRLSPLFEEIVYFTPDLPRATQYDEIFSSISTEFRNRLRSGNWQNIESELKELTQNPPDGLLITGSIYLIGRVLSVIKNQNYSDSSALQDLL